MHRAGAAISKQHEIARVVAIGDGDLLDGRNHAGDGNTHDAIREREGVQADALAKLFQRCEGKRLIERDVSRAERRGRRQAVQSRDWRR